MFYEGGWVIQIYLNFKLFADWFRLFFFNKFRFWRGMWKLNSDKGWRICWYCWFFYEFNEKEEGEIIFGFRKFGRFSFGCSFLVFSCFSDCFPMAFLCSHRGMLGRNVLKTYAGVPHILQKHVMGWWEGGNYNLKTCLLIWEHAFPKTFLLSMSKGKSWLTLTNLN